jgi:hypothetical protein
MKGCIACTGEAFTIEPVPIHNTPPHFLDYFKVKMFVRPVQYAA